MMHKIAFFNVANASNDEKSLQYRYAQRENRVIESIRSEKPSVICIMELRTCSNLDQTAKIPAEVLGIRMALNTNLEVAALRPQNLDAMAFWRATLYDSTKVSHLQSFCKWAIPSIFGSNLPKERGVMFIFSQFQSIGDSKTFWVINSHMPIALEEKLKSIQWLNDHVLGIVLDADKNEKNPLIFYGGDQNTFFDDGGDEMMGLFKAKWIHVSEEASPTFNSFPQDPFQATSTLDHIFIYNNGSVFEKVEAKAIDTKEASDHFLMTLQVRI